MPEEANLPSSEEISEAIKSEVVRIAAVDDAIANKKLALDLTTKAFSAALSIAFAQVPILDSDSAQAISAKLIQLVSASVQPPND